MTNVTIVKNYRNMETLKALELSEVVRLIQSCEYHDAVMDVMGISLYTELTRLDDGRVFGASNFTDKVPRVCFASVMENRNRQKVRKAYTGLLLLEVNNLTSHDEAVAIRQGAAMMPQTLLAFVGASGRSVKIVCRGELFKGGLPEEEDEGVTLSFCLPIIDSRGENVGVMAVDLPVSLLSKEVHSVKPSPNSYSVLLSDKGSYIVHPDSRKLREMNTVLELAERTAEPSVREAAEAMMAGGSGVKTFQMYDENWYVFYKPFHYTPSTDRPTDSLKWSAGVVYLVDDILGSYHILILLVFGIIIVGMLLFVLLCQMIVRNQMRPLRMLTSSARSVAEGHYNETVPKAQRTDEIGQLQDLFRSMQQSLAAKSTELEQLTARLKLRSQELRRALGNAQGSDRMKTSFLHYMTTQMVLPSDLIERSVMKLSNNYNSLTPQEADYELSVIKEQSAKVLDLLDHMVEALEIEAEEAEKSVKERKEAAYE